MIGQGEFVHLHLHSHYSLPDGMLKIRDLVSKVRSCGMPAVALTDHETCLLLMNSIGNAKYKE